MADFKSLQAKHEELVRLEKSTPEFQAEVTAYIDEVRSASSEIFMAREREHLRANLRYWASFVYEHSPDRAYPSIELQTLSAKAVRRQQLYQLGRTLSVVGGIASIVIAVVGLMKLPGLLAPVTTESTTETATFELPLILTATQIAIAATPTTVPSDTPIISIRTATLSASTPAPTATISTSDQDVKSVRMLNPKEGDVVQVEVEFSGTFSNQQVGWTIHVIVQPLSQGGRMFPVRKSFPILEPSGDWVITDKIIEGEDLGKSETYILQVVVASDPETRQILEAAASEGLDILPSGAGEYGQPISVTREAVLAINETRIVFTYIDPVLLLPEIYSIRPDPDNLDLRRLTILPLYGEIQPVLAPDGNAVAFFTRVKDEQGNRYFTLNTAGLEVGSEPMQLAAAPERNIVYENPVWSPDGRYIAFSRGEQRPGSTTTFWRLALFDMQENKPIILPGGRFSSRYPFWIDDHTLGYTTRVEGTSGFMGVDINTGETAVFFNTAQDEQWGVLSPDGRYLAYLVPFGQFFRNDLYVVDLQGDGVPVRLTENNYQDQSPQWDPDGNTIYYITFATDRPSIWAVNRDGSRARQIFRSDEVGIDHISVGKLSVLLPVGP